jgi:RNA polymerase sigma-70 factor (ECF subfamily)
MPPNPSQPPASSFFDLLHLAREGSSSALGTLLEVYKCYLTDLACRKLDPGRDGCEWPSDAVQDTMVAALQFFAQFRGQTEDEFRGWLRTILVNGIRACHRAHGGDSVALVDPTSPDSPLLQCASPEPTAEQVLEEEEQEERLRRCFAELPAHYREILHLRFFGGLSFQRLGEHLGVSMDAARQRCNRATYALGQQLEEQGVLKTGCCEASH